MRPLNKLLGVRVRSSIDIAISNPTAICNKAGDLVHGAIEVSQVFREHFCETLCGKVQLFADMVKQVRDDVASGVMVCANLSVEAIPTLLQLSRKMARTKPYKGVGEDKYTSFH